MSEETKENTPLRKRPLKPVEPTIVPEEVKEEPMPEVPIEETVFEKSDTELAEAIESAPEDEDMVTEDDYETRLIEARNKAANKVTEQPEPEKKEVKKDDGIPTVPEEVVPESPRKKNDCSDYVFSINGSRRDLDNAYMVSAAQDTRSEEEKNAVPDPYQLNLATYLRYGVGTSQATLMTQFTRELETKANPDLKDASKDKAVKVVDTISPINDELRLAKIMPPIGNPNITGTQVLKGTMARTAIIARMKGVFRIPLYNSGFQICIRPMNLAELNAFTIEVDRDFEEIGRILGGYAHLVTDTFLKQKVMEILPGLIVSSNFDFNDDAKVLMDHISFHDYDVILWALCTMIYPEGIEQSLTCVNEKCQYVDTTQKVDLKNLCYRNLDGFSTEAIEWMVGGFHKKRTSEDLHKYRNQLLPAKKELSVANGNDKYQLQVPTLGHFCEYASSLIAKIIKLASGEKNLTTEQLRETFTLQLYRMYAPWIKSIDLYDDEKRLRYQVVDIEAIAEALEASSFEGTEFNTEFMNYIRDTKATYIGYTSLECPKCHKKPMYTKNNFVPFDVQHLFFCLSLRQLEQIGMQS